MCPGGRVLRPRRGTVSMFVTMPDLAEGSEDPASAPASSLAACPQVSSLESNLVGAGRCLGRDTESVSSPDDPEVVPPGEDELEQSVPCVWFFLPLPHPLGLPEGEAIAQASDVGDVVRETASPTGLDCSLAIHQVPRSTNIMLRDFADIVRLIEVKAFHREPVSIEEGRRLADELDESAGQASTLTVVEAALPGCTTEPERLNAGLDRAIELIRELQAQVATVTGEPVRLISRATLQPMLPVVSGRLFLNGTPPSFEDLVPSFFLDECAPPSAFSATPEPISAAHLEKLTNFSYQRVPAFQLIAGMRREALVQARFDGNPALGVVTAASAGELLLSTALLHCLWEDGISPQDGARPFRGEPGLSRTIGNLRQKLKGAGWDTTGMGPVANFYSTAQVRNRVLHGGYSPTSAELARALSTLEALEKFIGDALCSSGTLKYYPRTAIAWSGVEGIKRRRSRYPEWIDELRFDPTEPNWSQSFARWRLAVDRELGWQERKPGAAPEDCLLYLRQAGPDEFEYFVHDRGSGHAAILSQDAANALAHTDRAESLLRESNETMLLLPVPEDFALDGLTWIPDYEAVDAIVIHPGGDVWTKLEQSRRPASR